MWVYRNLWRVKILKKMEETQNNQFELATRARARSLTAKSAKIKNKFVADLVLYSIYCLYFTKKTFKLKIFIKGTKTYNRCKFNFTPVETSVEAIWSLNFWAFQSRKSRPNHKQKSFQEHHLRSIIKITKQILFTFWLPLS